MERQQAYLTAASKQLISTLTENTQGSWDKLEEMNQFIQTDITRNQYIDLINDLDKVDNIEYIMPEGEYKADYKYSEFYPDQEKLLDLVVRTFFI